MTVEEKLVQALKETFDEQTERIMKIVKPHRFSLAYRLWEHKTLRDLRRNRIDKRWTLKKARYVIAALTVAASLLIGGTAYAAIAGRFGFKDKVDYSKVLMETHPSDKTVIEEYYGLPEEDGWELTNCEIDVFGTMLGYQCGDTKISFSQDLESVHIKIASKIIAKEITAQKMISSLS